jgi:hypothetical protein
MLPHHVPAPQSPQRIGVGIDASRYGHYACGSRKAHRPTGSTPKGLVSDALRSEGERVQAANSVYYRWK